MNYTYMIIDTNTKQETPIKMGFGRSIESTYFGLKPNEILVRQKVKDGEKMRFAPMLTAENTIFGRRWVKSLFEPVYSE